MLPDGQPSATAVPTLSPHARLGLLNCLGNHEIKLILAVMLALRPGEWFGSRRLLGEFVTVQGPQPAWVPGAGGTAVLVRFVEHSIAACGAASTVVDKPGDWGNRVWRCQGNAGLAPWVLAFGGAVLGWSVDYPDLSVQQILGRQADGMRGPADVRHQIYTSLLRDPDNGASMASIFRRVGVSRRESRNVRHQVDRLAHLGIVKITSGEVGRHNPAFTVDARTRHFAVKSAEPGIGPEQSVLYRALDSMVRDTPATYTLDEFIEVCRTVAGDEPCDLARVRGLLVASRTRDNRIGLRFDATDHDLRQDATVVMCPEYVEPITDWCARLAGLDDPGLAARYQRQAENILTDPDAVNRLVRKARCFSAGVRTRDQPRELPTRLLDLVRDLGSVSVRQATSLASADGVVWDKGSVAHALRQLVATGELQTIQLGNDSSKKRAVTHYQLPGKPTRDDALHAPTAPGTPGGQGEHGGQRDQGQEGAYR